MTVTVKERPILFRGDMVRAILAGRKTQTRRVIKGWRDNPPFAERVRADGGLLAACPYGRPGDRLWVRETWTNLDESDEGGLPSGYAYRADLDEEVAQGIGGWHPSIFMPRRASRLTLEVVAVRVERLVDISNGDAQAEGFDPDRDEFRRRFQKFHKKPADWNPWLWVVEFRRVAE